MECRTMKCETKKTAMENKSNLKEDREFCCSKKTPLNAIDHLILLIIVPLLMKYDFNMCNHFRTNKVNKVCYFKLIAQKMVIIWLIQVQ